MFKPVINRRNFLSYLLKSAASLLAFGPFARLSRAGITTLEPRVGLPNPFVTPDGRPILVCVTGENYDTMLRAGLEAIGGLGRLFNDNQDVLLKLNCVIAEGYPTTSDVNSIVSTIHAIREATSGNITVGDSGYEDIQNTYQYLNYQPAIADAGGNLIQFYNTYDVRRNTWPPERPDFEVWSDIYDAPVIICLGNLKRHLWSHFTCALKNHVGSVTGPLLSGTRSYIHSFPEYSMEFFRLVPELAGLVNPELNIVDARLFWAINGPTSYQGGEIRPMDKVIICGDMVATDVYCSRLMDQFDETYDASILQPTIDHAVELGLGEADLSRVEIIELDVTGIDEEKSLTPDRISLNQNYPNPFNARTFIEFELPERSRVSLNVYNSLGRHVATLVDNTRSAGRHKVVWDGSRFSSGNYLLEIASDGYKQTRKMMLIK